MLEQYVYKNNKKMRMGYTTGSCAAAASKAAAWMLLHGQILPEVELMTPKGIGLHLEVLDPKLSKGEVSCAIRKDAGDDPDVTDGLLIYATVSKTEKPGVTLDGGEGVGRVTRVGLEQAVGDAAINKVPRQMIREGVEEICRAAGYTGGLSVIISIPGGEELARKTFNPRLGIVGGISVLGTSGIVEPMSEEALIRSVHLELDLVRASGAEDVLVTPGNYGEAFAREKLGLSLARWCTCSNYIGAAIDHAAGAGFRSVLLVGHLGKLIKVSAGCMNTHSKVADARRETLAAHAALAGGDRALVKALFDSPTTDAGVELLRGAGLLEPVMDSIAGELDAQLKRRAGPELAIEGIFFSNQYGILGKTPGAEGLLALHRA